MHDDPIVAEVRQRRDELLRSTGGGLDTLVQFLQEQEAKADRKPVRLAPKTLSPTRAG